MPAEIPVKEFWLAIRTNDHAKLESLCVGLPLPTFSYADKEGHLLSEAMQQSADLRVLQFLVDHGVNAHALPRGDGFSPLKRAISSRRLDYFDFILGLGVDPITELSSQRITLMGSSIPVDLQLQFLERLIERGVDLNFLFSLFGDMDRAFTALDHAQHPEVKALLRAHGALTGDEVRAKNGDLKSKKTPVDEVVDFMLSQFGKAEARSFTDILNAGSGISVHVIKPQSKAGCWTIFTTGLSRHRMNVTATPACDGHVELYMQLPSDWDLLGNRTQSKWSFPWSRSREVSGSVPIGGDATLQWPVQLLSKLAAYAIDSSSVFEVPVTIITNGDPPEQLHPSVPFTANCLFADKDFKRSDGKIVNLFCVMPLFQSEAEMALRSIPNFLNALDRAGVNRVLDTNRKPIFG